LEIHLSTIQQAVERRWLMEVGEYYHLWFLSSSLPHVFSEGAHEELVLVLSDHQLRILASTKSLGIWTLQLNGNHEYGLSDHSEIVKTAVQVSLEEFPLYISWVYKSKQFYELLKGGD
jgi:hypothetical protein